MMVMFHLIQVLNTELLYKDIEDSDGKIVESTVGEQIASIDTDHNIIEESILHLR